jgi:hypothetical protein
MSAAPAIVFLASWVHAEGVVTRRPLPPATVIRARVAAVGTMNTVSELAEPVTDAAAWSELLTKVAAGSSEWLGVAELLAPGTDAGLSLQLRFAITHALARQPTNVLRILGGVYDASGVCGDENVFMDADTYKAAMDELRSWTQRVTSVSEPTLAASRKSCLEGLHRLSQELDRNRARWFAQ